MEVGSYPEIVVPSCRSLFPFLTGATRAAACAFRNSVPDGVMAAQATLTRLVMVRIHVGQPNCAAIWMADRGENEVDGALLGRTLVNRNSREVRRNRHQLRRLHRLRDVRLKTRMERPVDVVAARQSG